MALTLGIIPQWQFSQDPAVNYNLNPNLTFPVGMNQLTVQPINNVVASGDANLQGLGITMADWANKPVAVPGGVAGLAVFDSWWWNNRKWIAFGALGILAIAIGAVATKALR